MATILGAGRAESWLMAGLGGTTPKVSVCVPAYQAGDFIETAINSVLAQTMTAWELVVYNNGSTDQTQQILRSFESDPRIRVEASVKTVPMADSWNWVASQARAPYFKLLCADDVLHPECLEAQLRVLEDNPQVALVASQRHFIDSSGVVIIRDRGLGGLLGTHHRSNVLRRVAFSGMNPIGWPSAMMCRLEDFKEIGGFDETMPSVMDLDLAVRMLGCGSFHGIDRALAMFRITETSASATLKHQGRDYRRWLRCLGKTDPSLSRWGLARGHALSFAEPIKRRLLYAAVNSRKPMLAKLPSVVLRSPHHDADLTETGTETNGMAAQSHSI